MINTVQNIDCLIGMQSIPDKSVDMVLTSPPYDNLRNYNNSLKWDFEGIAFELFRVLNVGGVVVWVVNDATINGSESGTSFRQALHFIDLGLRLHDTMIWKKRNPMPLTQNRLDPCFEYIFCFSKGKPKTFNPLLEPTVNFGMIKKRGLEKKAAIDNKSASRMREENSIVKKDKYRKNILEYSVGIEKGRSENLHPAVFPLELAKDQIELWTKKDDIVLDCFSGSGTTQIACIDTERNYIGFEKEEMYYNIIQDRIQKHTQQLKLIA
jgi:DNA modification methylase